MSYNLPTMTAASRDMEREREKEHRRRTQPASSPIDTASRHSTVSELSRAPTATDDAAVQPPPPASHQRFVLADHVAARYLEEDASTTLLSPREKLEGYEAYLVEQWACSRVHPTFVITTYTGDPKDIVWGHVLGVPKDESQWPQRLRTYFKALDEFHARRRETSLGTVMITNLSSVPSSLTIIPVPDGDLKNNRELFFVNENLKRLGCSGRTGIKLAVPSNATQAKFHQLYRISDKIPLNSSVIELVKLCQVALVFFGKLEPAYADGLLCDVTERAINDWWVEFGAEYYTAEPHDGILGPTTVAALLGMLMGARNRLSAYNAPVAKDVFEMESTRRAISYFQKTQKIQKTRYLDRQTLERLRRATAKAASRESWAVPRAFKGAVAELGGKGGEMVMGMVGAGEKAGIAEIETTDIERFVELVSGERAKWLWHGKPRKTQNGDMFNRLPREERSPSPEDRHPTNIANLIKRESMLEGRGFAKHDGGDAKRVDTSPTIDGTDNKDPSSKRAAIKRATEKIETGSGFHRIKDVVGRRNHQPKHSKDDAHRNSLHQTSTDAWSPPLQTTDSPSSAKLPEFKQTQHLRHEALASRRPVSNYGPTIANVLTETPTASSSTLDGNIPPLDSKAEPVAPSKPAPENEDTSRPPSAEPSIAGSIYHGIDLDAKLPSTSAQYVPPVLRRTRSTDQLDPAYHKQRNDDWWPRHLSFSIAQESVLRWQNIVSATTTPPTVNEPLPAALATSTLLSEEAKRLGHKLALTSSLDAPWVTSYILRIADLDVAASNDTVQLENLYLPAFESYQSLREDAHEIISSNRALVQEGLRDLTMLSDKLEYEIGSLRSKVDDVEDGVEELERQVEFVEGRVGEAEGELGGRRRRAWWRWAVEILTGIEI